ncbi:hypothetical protein GGI20_003382 [Coemansia sp. BCRC 34301]|nr:hypothetical protein GGI20_003382 [Coemansia sp. BCRC 34301]
MQNMELTVLYTKNIAPSRSENYIVKYRYSKTTTFADIVEFIVKETELYSPVTKLVHPHCTRDIRPSELVHDWDLKQFGSILFLRINNNDSRFNGYHVTTEFLTNHRWARIMYKNNIDDIRKAEREFASITKEHAMERACFLLKKKRVYCNWMTGFPKVIATDKRTPEMLAHIEQKEQAKKIKAAERRARESSKKANARGRLADRKTNVCGI